MKYKQRGEYYKYPDIIEEENIWKEGEDFPSWLLDQVKIVKITDEGKYILDYSTDSDGGLIIKSQRGGTLVVLPKDGYLIYSKDKGILGITEKQLYLLYEEEK